MFKNNSANFIFRSRVEMGHAVEASVTSIKTEEVLIQSFDGVSLSGTLTVPQDMRMLFIPLHGSFVQTRNGDLSRSAKVDVSGGCFTKRSIFQATNKYTVSTRGRVFFGMTKELAAIAGASIPILI